MTVAAFPPACPNCGAPLGVVVEGRGQVFESLDGPVVRVATADVPIRTAVLMSSVLIFTVLIAGTP